MKKRIRMMLGVCVGLAAALLALTPSGRVVAGNGTGEDEQTLAELGLTIAPVPLTYSAADKDLVGLGSFLVNAVADCDGCHNSGSLPNLNYTPGFNPYFGQHPAKIDPSGYLAGGEDFGQVTVDANFSPIGPHIISRNLTPNKTGRPEGGNTFDQFRSRFP
jgi:hypothetical protein